MRLAYVDLCGFRGYRKPFRIDFPDGFTIIDGRNGVGKSTIFDAIEFALTGTITKYGDAKANGETVADYFWWTGKEAAQEHYVEVGFREMDKIVPLRRSRLLDADPQELSLLQDSLCEAETAPESPLRQLCTTSIIRDELIATLSLDLKDTDRYSLLRDAIGATDADVWIERAQSLLNLAKRRVETAKREVEEATREGERAAHRLDEIRAALVEEATLADSTARLQSFAGSTAAPDQLFEPVRIAIAKKSRQLEQLSSLERTWQEVELARERLPDLRQAVSAALDTKAQADSLYAATAAGQERTTSSEVWVQRARDLSALVSVGRRLGLHEGRCPLCASNRTASEFANGLALAEAYAKDLDKEAFEQAERERTNEAAANAAEAARRELERRQSLLLDAQSIVSEFEGGLAKASLSPVTSIAEIRQKQQALHAELEAARSDVRILESLKLNAELDKAVHREAEVKGFYSRVQARLGLALRSESRAKALHDAARRAANETLNRRLERVLPLMAELYRRLRPHPFWADITYRIRGDVRRFLKLQVGDELNPQFIFSSGQRRATGLAFLLSVNLSLAWSRWKTILLDDPVQHVDDFRSVHLAEVLAQLATSGRQIVCAVEDAALADLLCRRLPIAGAGRAKRVTLGPDAEGALAKLREQDLVPLPQRALVTEPRRLAS